MDRTTTIDEENILWALAEQFHIKYIEVLQKEGRLNEYGTFSELSRELKLTNYQKALDFYKSLEKIHCYLSYLQDFEIELSDEEISYLNKECHEAWVRKRIETGWAYSRTKCVDLKLTPYLVPWEYLPPEIANYDIKEIQGILNLVKEMGLHICRKQIETKRKDKCYEEAELPIIISVMGSGNLTEFDVATINTEARSFLKEYKVRYGNNRLLLMTSLLGDSDRIVAQIAIEMGIRIAPVIPKSIADCGCMLKTEKSLERFMHCTDNEKPTEIRTPVKEFYDLLNDPLCLDPCIVEVNGKTIFDTYRYVSSYMLSNSHVMLTIGDSNFKNNPIGPYDAIKSLFIGIESEYNCSSNPRYPYVQMYQRDMSYTLSSNSNTLLYWIPIAHVSDTEKNIRDSSDNNPLPKTPCYLSRVGKKNNSSQSLKNIIENGLKKDSKSQESMELFAMGHEIALDKSDTIPPYFLDIFDKIMQINQEMSMIGNLSSGELPPDKDNPMEYDLAQMKKRYMAVKKCSEYYKAKNDRALLILITLTTLGSFAFNLMIMLSSSILLTGLYAILYVLSMFMSWRHYRTNEHRKYIEYRLLEENIRVDYYWSIMHVQDSATMHCPEWTENSLSWLKAVLISSSSAFTNDYHAIHTATLEKRLNYTLDKWVAPSCQNYSDKRDDNSSKEQLFSKRYGRIVICTSVLSVIIAFSVAVIADAFNQTLFIYRYLLDPNEANITWHLIFNLVLVILVNITSYITMKHDFRHESRKRQYAVLTKIFESAIYNLEAYLSDSARSLQDKIDYITDIFHDLGEKTLDIFNDWATETIDVDFKNNVKNVNPSVD